MPDTDKDNDPDKDQTTRPSLRKGDRPVQPSGSARQPVYDRNTTPDAASGDPTE
ncbi:hypothetical protein [uncultured Paracoccus sp.]|uniref:hypothetical protein n=1 Tax=uncultured Paracoccus sp. TaxID=189685 RepID=UPI0025E8C91B|nr:hypothetical protein [uncultured Paracoccus sp.]